MSLATENERALVLAEAEKQGYPAPEVDAAVSIESGWKSHAMHPVTRAGGLIGFMPFVLRKLGWTGTPEAFYQLSPGEQAPWVGKYFEQHKGRWKRPGDTYMALAAPAFLGADDSKIVYPRSSNPKSAYILNPGWRGKDGEITAGSIRAVLLRKMAGGSRKLPETSTGGNTNLIGVGIGAYLLYRAVKLFF